MQVNIIDDLRYKEWLNRKVKEKEIELKDMGIDATCEYQLEYDTSYDENYFTGDISVECKTNAINEYHAKEIIERVRAKGMGAYKSRRR